MFLILLLVQVIFQRIFFRQNLYYKSLVNIIIYLNTHIYFHSDLCGAYDLTFY